VTAVAGPAGCRCELGGARRHLERAIAELEQARLAWGCGRTASASWPGSGPSVAGGFGLLDDHDYGRALRMGGWFDDAARAAGAALVVAGGGAAGVLPVCPCASLERQ